MCCHSLHYLNNQIKRFYNIKTKNTPRYTTHQKNQASRIYYSSSPLKPMLPILPPRAWTKTLPRLSQRVQAEIHAQLTGPRHPSRPQPVPRWNSLSVELAPLLSPSLSLSRPAAASQVRASVANSKSTSPQDHWSSSKSSSPYVELCLPLFIGMQIRLSPQRTAPSRAEP